VSGDHAVEIERHHAIERRVPFAQRAARFEIHAGIAPVEEEVAGVQHAVLDEQHHQVAARVAAPEVLEANRLAAHREIVDLLEGLVRERARGAALPIGSVEVQQVVARALRRHLGARGERVP
jgi:hypothetical protein